MSDDPTPDSGPDPRVEALGRASRSIPVAPLDAAGVVRAARARRRRQRTVVASALAAAVVVVGVAVTTVIAGDRTGAVPDAAVASGTPSARPFPDAPAGSRWVGMNGVVLAVPDAWPVVDSACGDGSPAVVLDGTGSAGTDCRYYEDVRVSFVPGDEAQAGQDETTCELSNPGTCYLVRSFPEQGVSVEVSVARVSRAADLDEAERLLASAMVLPDGWTTVPFRDWQRRDAAGRAAHLQAAGFEVDTSHLTDAEAREVRTDPPSGVPVRVGATITLVPEGLAGDLSVEVTSLGYNNRGLRTGVAFWDEDERAVVLRSDGRFGCPPAAEVAPAGATVRLTVTSAACGDRVEQMAFAVRGLDAPPDEISVTEDGSMTTLPVLDADPDTEIRDFDVDYTVPVDATDLAAGAARWDSRDGTLTYRPREEDSSCPADPSGSFSDTRFYLVLTVRDDVVCDASLGGVYVVRGLRQAPEELTVTERGEARTVRVDQT